MALRQRPGETMIDVAGQQNESLLLVDEQDRAWIVTGEQVDGPLVLSRVYAIGAWDRVTLPSSQQRAAVRLVGRRVTSR
jgi:hypothetical protein